MLVLVLGLGLELVLAAEEVEQVVQLEDEREESTVQCVIKQYLCCT